MKVSPGMLNPAFSEIFWHGDFLLCIPCHVGSKTSPLLKVSGLGFGVQGLGFRV